MSSAEQSPAPSFPTEKIEALACPVCATKLHLSGDNQSIQCSSCRRGFENENGIPLMFWPNEWDSDQDVTEIVRAFYDETPFPNYEDVDSAYTLRAKAERGMFARLLDEQIPHGARVLEVGCGTGQLSNFLGLKWGRTVFGTDLSLNALKLAQDFKNKNQVDNVLFVQMNLFRPSFCPESFDLVICNGVLHHTSDPFLGFQTISKLVRKGGYIIIGLYNKYGRLPTDFRRFMFRATGDHFKFLDPRLRDKTLSGTRKATWFMDQYKHPHESKHTIGEVLKWFGSEGFEYSNGIPKATALDQFAANEQLFSPNPTGSWLDHFLVQGGMLLGGGKEGGFFVMIGHKSPG